MEQPARQQKQSVTLDLSACKMSLSFREFVSQTAEDRVRPTPAVNAHIFLRGGECSIRTRLVSIPVSSALLLRTCVTEEENRGKNRG